MSEDNCFNFDEARCSEARIRAFAEEIERVFKNLKNKVDESAAWWAGPSREAFALEAYEFLAQKHNILNVIRIMADGMAKTIEDKTRHEDEACAFISSQESVLATGSYGTPVLRACPDQTTGTIAGHNTPRSAEPLTVRLDSVRTVRSTKVISEQEAGYGELGVWFDSSACKYYENLVEYTPERSLITREISQSNYVTIKYDSMPDGVLRRINTSNMPELEIKSYNDQLNKRIDAIRIKNIGIDIRVVQRDDRDLLIHYYETLNPENAKIMDKLFEEIAEHGHQEDIQNMKFTLYTADEPYRTLMLSNVHKMKIGNHHAELQADKNGKYSQYYNGFLLINSITISILPIDGKDNPKGPYNTVFHEIGHGIDDVTTAFGYTTTYYIDQEFEKKLNALIQSRVHDAIREMIETVVITQAYQNVDREKVFMALLAAGGDVRYLNGAEWDTFKGVVDRFRVVFKADEKKEVFGEFCVVTDMFSAYVAQEYDAQWKGWSIFGGYVHNEDYWHGILKDRDKRVSKEFIAGYFSARATGNLVQIDLLKAYFPEACEAADRMFEQMAEQQKSPMAVK